MKKNIKYYFPFNTSKDVYIYIFLQVTSQIITSSHALSIIFLNEWDVPEGVQKAVKRD